MWVLAVGTALGLGAVEPVPKWWDNFADTWVATVGNSANRG